ncbi:hypothetical protein BG004_004831 [Podila humilis]|nr:hypothetical protein BG004_004831 [Podila humilis]
MDEDTTTPRDAAVMDPPTLAIDNSSLDSSDRTSEKRSRSPEPEPEAVAEAVEVAATPSSPVLDPVIENNPEAPRQTKDDEEPKDSSLSDVRAKSPEQVQDMSTLSQASYGPIQPTEVESQAHANVFDNSKGLETAAAIDSPSAKRRRISLPGKSILKPNQTDDTGTFSNHDPQEDTMTGNHDDFPSADVTETFSSITDFQKRNRKSFGRRVSFAATARIRMFERDEKEEEMPKTTSFIEGLNPRITLEYPFTFRTRTGNDGNNPDTLESSTSAEDLHEQSQPDTVSSESERDNE